MGKKRISIKIPLPSLSLKNFMEKIIKDDDFFSLALENPLAMMKDCGLNLDIKAFTPSDFANFFGALTGLKEALKDADQKSLDFESIFGEPAEIRGSMLEADRHQGFFKEWDNKDAFREKGICRTTDRYFIRDIGKEGQKPIRIAQNLDIKTQKFITPERLHLADIQRDLVSRTMESSETWNHTVTEWSTDRFSQSNTRSERGVDKNFEGISMMEDLVQGPLIDPVDLASVSARLETFTQMLGNKL